MSVDREFMRAIVTYSAVRSCSVHLGEPNELLADIPGTSSGRRSSSAWPRAFATVRTTVDRGRTRFFVGDEEHGRIEGSIERSEYESRFAELAMRLIDEADSP